MKITLATHRLLITCMALGMLVTGCGLVYKADVQQGNVLDAEDIEQLEPGLSKRQVLVLLGSPSIADPFHQDRWDYVSSYSPRGGKITRKQLLLTFERDELISIDGDYLDSLTLAEDAVDDITNNQQEDVTAPLPGSQPTSPLPTTPSDGDGGGN